MIKLIRDQLSQVINNIDAGNTNITEEQGLEVMRLLSTLTNPKERLSKYQACNKLGISRATFDRYVKAGKLPQGRHQQGVIGLFWYQEDIDKLKEQL